MSTNWVMCGHARGPAGLPDEWPDDYENVPCCMGAAMRGPSSCTCWEPVYDLKQQAPRTDLPSETQPKLCGDCAYRPDSPEQQDGVYLPQGPTSTFWCHQGIRRPVEWRHPDGRVMPGEPADYDPPIIEGRPYRADGTPALQCAGWALRAGASA